MIVVQVEEAMYSAEDAERYMAKLDGLVAANDPTTIARYIGDVAAVINSPSIQDALDTEQRRSVSTTHRHTTLQDALDTEQRRRVSTTHRHTAPALHGPTALLQSSCSVDHRRHHQTFLKWPKQ